jgi:IS5 family transposase
MPTYRAPRQVGLFDYTDHLAALAKSPTALDRLNEIVPWSDAFRSTLERAVLKAPKGPGGRPRWDVVLMFRVLVLQSIYGLSDAETEAQIRDRFSFQRFIGVTLSDGAPDANTIRDFREALRLAQAEQPLWDAFWALLHQLGVKLSSGKIVDATFIQTRRQENTQEENETLKRGETPESWSTKNQAQLRQKDRDTRWARKGADRHYGYKAHAKVDAATKLIELYRVTGAHEQDCLIAPILARRTDGAWWADKGYDRTPVHEALAAFGIDDRILQQARRNHPLTDEQRELNSRRRFVRARVEHPFARLAQMRADFVRSIGLARAAFTTGLRFLVYNLDRLRHLVAKV